MNSQSVGSVPIWAIPSEYYFTVSLTCILGIMLSPQQWALMSVCLHWENVYRKIIGIYRNFDAKLLNSYFATVSEVLWELIAPNLLILLLSIQNLKYKLA